MGCASLYHGSRQVAGLSYVCVFLDVLLSLDEVEMDIVGRLHSFNISSCVQRRREAHQVSLFKQKKGKGHGSS